MNRCTLQLKNKIVVVVVVVSAAVVVVVVVVVVVKLWKNIVFRHV
jgi:hypothetical protein